MEGVKAGTDSPFGISALRRLRHALEWRDRRQFREMETKMRRLGEWPRLLPDDEVSLVRQALDGARHVFRAPRALLLWEQPDELARNLALVEGDRFEVSLAAPGEFEPPVDPALETRDFFFGNGSAPDRATVWNGRLKRIELSGDAIHSGLRERFGIRSALALHFSSEAATGRLFLLDLGRVSRSDFSLGGLTMALIAARAEQVAQMGGARSDAAADERFRVARDLHDGLLQSFTGVVLQLETVHDLLEKNPAEARRMVTQAESTIMGDQRELRRYVDELRPARRRHIVEFDLRARLDELRDRLTREWQIDLQWEMAEVNPVVIQALGQETYRIVSEAVMNAAKHGQASSIRADLATREDRLWIRVRDDGIGFPFRGRYNLASLMEKQQGPSVLGERVAALNGEMILESTEEGATLEIFLPLGFRAEE